MHHWIYPFQVIVERLWFLWQKSPAPKMREKILTSDLSISGWFWASLLFVAEKPPPPPAWGKIFWLWIYLFQAILSKFGFCGRKAPSPRMRENFLTLDLSISGDFEQVWLLWQKSPTPLEEGKFFDFGSIHFRRFWAKFAFCGRKAPPPRMRENFLTLDLSISGDFDQLCFLWQKSPPLFFCLWWDTQLMLQHMM